MPDRRRPPLLHIASEVFDTPLMVLPKKVRLILAAVGHRLVVDQSSLRELIDSGVLKSYPRASWDADDDDNADFDSPSPNSSKKPYKVTDSGVAIIPVQGILMKKGGWMTALSGCSS